MPGAADLPMTESLRCEYEQMLLRLEKGRERAQRLRDLADQATDQVMADERLVRVAGRGFGSFAAGDDSRPWGAIRGQRLREVAVEVLKKHVQPGDEVHYREWFELLRDEDVVVAGRDPLATFLAQVSRSDAVEAVGGRSGRYRLRAVA